MKTGNDATGRVIDVMSALGVPYMLVGSYSSNYYGIPRSTRDADFVAVFDRSISSLSEELGSDFILDPQASFEGITGTMREIFMLPSIPFKIEIFHLSDDSHDRCRFERKIQVYDDILQRNLFIPTAEDVIVTKLRWEKLGGRGKDAEDVRAVIAVQGKEMLDFSYIRKWADEHRTEKLLDDLLRSIPEL